MLRLYQNKLAPCRSSAASSVVAAEPPLSKQGENVFKGTTRISQPEDKELYFLFFSIKFKKDEFRVWLRQRFAIIPLCLIIFLGGEVDRKNY